MGLFGFGKKKTSGETARRSETMLEEKEVQMKPAVHEEEKAPAQPMEEPNKYAGSICAYDFRRGTTFLLEGQPYAVLDFQHIKPGKGRPFVRAKCRNIITGAIREESFNSEEKFDKVMVGTKKMTYLYSDGGLCYFMDPETFEEVSISSDLVADAVKYLRENDEATVMFCQGKPFDAEAPDIVNLLVGDTEPDDNCKISKAATLETGCVIQVPLDVKAGERIKINTITHEYLGRAEE